MGVRDVGKSAFFTPRAVETAGAFVSAEREDVRFESKFEDRTYR